MDLSRLDPELAPALDAIGPDAWLDLSEPSRLPELRARSARALAAWRAKQPPVAGVSVVPFEVGGVPARRYLPGGNGDRPVLVWLHGGGFLLGSMDHEEPLCLHLAKVLDCAVVGVGYRLAPEHPYPAAVDDVVAVIEALARGGTPGLDPSRLVLGGASAGGGLAAMVALRLRGRVPLLGQVLLYPMLDDHNDTPSARATTDPRVWNHGHNAVAWRALRVPPGGAPAHAPDLAGLPPTWIAVGDLDAFHDEDLAFAERLRAAGVPTEQVVFPGCPHAWEDLAPDAAVSRRLVAARDDALRRALRGALGQKPSVSITN